MPENSFPPLTAETLEAALTERWPPPAVIAVSMSDYYGLAIWEYPDNARSSIDDRWRFPGIGIQAPTLRVGSTLIVGAEQEPGTIVIYEFG